MLREGISHAAFDASTFDEMRSFRHGLDKWIASTVYYINCEGREWYFEPDKIHTTKIMHTPDEGFTELPSYAFEAKYLENLPSF